LPLAVAQPLTAVQGQLLITALPTGSHDLRLDGQPVHLDGDGRFMLGVDRDFTGTKALEWVTKDGRSARRDLVVTGREWVIDRLPARLNPPADPNAPRNLEYEAKREAEVAQVKSARHSGARPSSGRPRGASRRILAPSAFMAISRPAITAAWTSQPRTARR
jgi:hypothetical protein